MRTEKAVQFTKDPHPQPLSHPVGEGGVGLSPARRGSEVNPGLAIDAGAHGLVLTREELAAALKVSLRTVDRMVAAEEIPVMDLGEDLVRFYLPDVLEALRSGKVKFGRRAETEPNIQQPTANSQRAESHEEAQAAQNAKGGPHGLLEVTTNHTNHTKESTETRTTGEANQ